MNAEVNEKDTLAYTNFIPNEGLFMKDKRVLSFVLAFISLKENKKINSFYLTIEDRSQRSETNFKNDDYYFTIYQCRSKQRMKRQMSHGLVKVNGKKIFINIQFFNYFYAEKDKNSKFYSEFKNSMDELPELENRKNDDSIAWEMRISYSGDNEFYIKTFPGDNEFHLFKTKGPRKAFIKFTA